MSHSVFFSVQIHEQKFYDVHFKTVHWSWHGITHMRLWSSMKMQYIRTKQAEEKWSLHQYNFLAGSCKTVPLACHSKEWIKIPTLNIRRLPPAVKRTVRIFSSRTDWTQESFFPCCLLSPKDCIFRHELCPKWVRHALISNPGHCCHSVLNGGFQVSINYGWKNVHIKFCSLRYRMSEYILRTLGVYWPVKKKCKLFKSLNCK